MTNKRYCQSCILLVPYIIYSVIISIQDEDFQLRFYRKYNQFKTTAQASIILYRNTLPRIFKKRWRAETEAICPFPALLHKKKTYKQRQVCLALNTDMRKNVDIKTKIHINTSPGIFCKILSLLTVVIFLTIRVSLSLV